MKIGNLSKLKKSKLEEITLGVLPGKIQITDFAKEKAYKVNELVREIHRFSYEWYGYTIASRNNPELITNIGIGKNENNHSAYTSITPEEIDKYRESLHQDEVINGWIHSHGNLGFRQFSGTDDNNHPTVLSYVVSLLRKPLAKREVSISDLSMLVKGNYNEDDLRKGSVSLIADTQLPQIKIMERIDGGFCYSIVIGDEGWHEQKIIYEKSHLLTGRQIKTKKVAEIEIVPSGKVLDVLALGDLKKEVKEKISPPTYNYLNNYFIGFKGYNFHEGAKKFASKNLKKKKHKKLKKKPKTRWLFPEVENNETPKGVD
tara:strand:- start:18289 stop:19236 length:948 start_codon:yes stop_codon:yes gene_type:complete